jgi:hypothetical protein
LYASAPPAAVPELAVPVIDLCSYDDLLVEVAS